MERTIAKIELHLSAPAGENGGVTGRVVPYGVPDGRPGVLRGKTYTNTVYEPGCFDAWLTEFGASRTRFLFDHGDAELPLVAKNEHGINAMPIGVVTTLRSESDGLYFDAAFAGSAQAQTVRELVSIGGLRDLSMASNAVKADVRADGYRHVTQAELWDISVVVWGQFAEDAAILDVHARETHQTDFGEGETITRETRQMTDMAPTCGSMFEGRIYDAITDMFADWRQCGMITAPQFLALSDAAGRILSAAQAELPADIAALDCPMPSMYWRRGHSETTSEEKPESIEPGAPDATVADDDGADLNARIRIADYESFLGG